MIHYFPVAKLRQYFESCICCLWKIREQGKIGNSYKSTDYGKPCALPYGKLPAKAWKVPHLPRKSYLIKQKTITQKTAKLNWKFWHS